jgi:outer membrane protein assembly factor BamC
MKNFICSVMLLMAVFSLSGCGLFPDKEKDYRFTRELPELVVPSDLDKPVAVKPVDMPEAAPEIALPSAKDAQPAVESPVSPPLPLATKPDNAPEAVPEIALPAAKEVQPAPGTLAASPPPVAKEAPQSVVAEEAKAIPEAGVADETPIPVSNYAEDVADADEVVATEITLHETPNQPAFLHINQNLPRSWRIVAKAMMQRSLEISERNTTANYFVVQYDPNAKAMQDESFWDDLSFIFGEENNQERPYRVALTEKDQQTDIRVLNMQGNVCKTGVCSQLLLLLKNALEKSLKE